MMDVEYGCLELQSLTDQSRFSLSWGVSVLERSVMMFYFDVRELGM